MSSAATSTGTSSGLGALIGVAVIVIDEILTRTGKFRLPPLAVGMGMYLPISLVLMIAIGSVVGLAYNKWADKSGGDVERKKRMGVLLATGLIVGESLFGVVFAGIVAATSDDSPLAIVGDNFLKTSEYLGVILFVLLVAWLYKKTQQIASRPVEDEPADLTKS